MYDVLFFTNLLRLLDERKITKQQLADHAGISISFLSDLTNGKAMEAQVKHNLAQGKIALPTEIPSGKRQ